MVIAAAQTIPKDGDIKKNLNDHYKFIEIAAHHKARLIIFPELSLTGYVREKAHELSFIETDSKLAELQKLALVKQITIIAGAPIQSGTGLNIGSFIITPTHPIQIYTKQFLHEGEEKYFTPSSTHNPQIVLGDDLCSLAICADINNPLHAENAHKIKSTIYLASLFYTNKGITQGCLMLKEYARKYSLDVLMANYGGPSSGLEAGGTSSFWNKSLNVTTSFAPKGEGLVLAKKENQNWTSALVGIK